MKQIFTFLIVLLLSTSLVLAHGEETFAEAEDIILDKILCEELSEDQIESLGDYHMKQMHPGEAHERMDAMMGGEGSESLRQMHISMDRSSYCGEHDAMSSGMMNTMMGGMRNNNFGGGDTMAYGMMGSMGMGWFGWFYFAIGAFIFSVIFWLTKDLFTKEKKRKK